MISSKLKRQPLDWTSPVKLLPLILILGLNLSHLKPVAASAGRTHIPQALRPERQTFVSAQDDELVSQTPSRQLVQPTSSEKLEQSARLVTETQPADFSPRPPIGLLKKQTTSGPLVHHHHDEDDEQTQANRSSGTIKSTAEQHKNRQRRSDDVCSDRLCYGLPMGCLDRAPTSQQDVTRVETSGSLCSVLVTSKRLIDPYRPVARDIHFELVALPQNDRSNYAAVGFSETGRMAGLVTECLQYRDSVTQLQIIKMAHSYNIPGVYSNVPATILSGIKNLGVSYENGYYQCRWVVESAVEFTYEEPNGTVVNKREDLGYKNYHILLASGEYNERNNYKHIHTDRVSSMTPISLAQTGLIKSLGSHILIRIHGSLMVTIWVGLVTISVMLARYYKNEWSDSKINDLAIWFVLHRAFMLIAWFGSIIAVIFAYMYTETYHAVSADWKHNRPFSNQSPRPFSLSLFHLNDLNLQGIHQISGTTCLVLSTIQVLGGLLRPSLESSKRVYFNWTHFICGNLSYLFAMISIVTAAFLAPAHLPPLYIWVVAAFVAVYALTHLLLTIHQYIIHKSSKISITPKGDFDGEYVKDSYPFRQVMMGFLVAIVIFIVLLLLWIITIRAT